MTYLELVSAALDELDKPTFEEAVAYKLAYELCANPPTTTINNDKE